MKKIIFIMILSLSAAFFACGDDEITTLKWKNEASPTSETVNEIRWYAEQDFITGSGTPDQTWGNGHWAANGAETPSKEITKLNGGGMALVGGDTYDIVLDNHLSTTSIEKNTDAMLVIDDLNLQP